MVLFLACLPGCTADDVLPGAARQPGATRGAGAAGSSAGPSTGPGPTGLSSGPRELVPIAGAPATFDSGALPDGEKACVGSGVSAPPASNPKVDLIWVVDASGSMLDEQMKIGANLGAFADTLAASKLDIHIVMLTTSAAIPVICPVTPPDPLAGSTLATDPRYRFVNTVVDSYNSLDVALSSFPMYADFLRPEAATHFVFVSDDESRYKGLATPDERAQTFYADMKQQLGKDFIEHTISSEGPTPCNDPMCNPDTSTGICAFVMLGCGAAAPGATYYSLANTTGGLTASICQSDWRTIFEPLILAVIESVPLPCDYAIPPPPPGESLDPARVNVGWLAPGQTAESVLPKVVDASACMDAAGWHYDTPDQPTQVLLCPNACQQVAAGGTLNIVFGCATIEVL